MKDWFDYFQEFAQVEYAATSRTPLKKLAFEIAVAYYPAEPYKNF